MADLGKVKSVAGSLLPDSSVKDAILSGGMSLLSPKSPISDVIAAVAKAGGIARPNRFAVMINLPPGFTGFVPTGKEAYGIQDSKQVVMACEISQIPGRSLTTTQSRTYGPIRENVTGRTYPPIDMTFRVHNNMQERNFFEAWQETAISTHSHDSHYPNEYLAKIEIIQLAPPPSSGGLFGGTIGGVLGAAQGLAASASQQAVKALGVANAAFNKITGGKNDIPVATYILEDAFPAILGPLALDHGQNDSYHRQSVTFNYRMWKLKGIKYDSASGRANPGSLSDMGIRADAQTAALKNAGQGSPDYSNFSD